jgi:excisionase family DNA binding protein
MDDYLSEQEAATLLRVKVNTLRAWASRRKGPARCKVGKRVLYRKGTIAAWLEGCEVDPAAARRRALA